MRFINSNSKLVNVKAKLVLQKVFREHFLEPNRKLPNNSNDSVKNVLLLFDNKRDRLRLRETTKKYYFLVCYRSL